MPLYEYRCRDCRAEFEELVGKTVPEKTPLCPKCGSENCERLFSTFATVGSRTGHSAPPCTGGGCGGGRFT